MPRYVKNTVTRKNYNFRIPRCNGSQTQRAPPRYATARQIGLGTSNASSRWLYPPLLRIDNWQNWCCSAAHVLAPRAILRCGCIYVRGDEKRKEAMKNMPGRLTGSNRSAGAFKLRGFWCHCNLMDSDGPSPRASESFIYLGYYCCVTPHWGANERRESLIFTGLIFDKINVLDRS